VLGLVLEPAPRLRRCLHRHQERPEQLRRLRDRVHRGDGMRERPVRLPFPDHLLQRDMHQPQGRQEQLRHVREGVRRGLGVPERYVYSAYAP
jgi:hypothetical protein